MSASCGTSRPIRPVGSTLSPSFAAIDVQLGASTLRIRRLGGGAYIQSGTLNGRPLGGRAWLWVREVHAGGELALTMGAAPGATWGATPPPSFAAASDKSPSP